MRKRLLTAILMLSVLFTIPAYAGDTDEWINDWDYSVFNSNPSNLTIKLKGYKGSDPTAHVYGRVMIDGVSYKVAVESYEVVNGDDSRYDSSFNRTEGADIEELYFHAVDGQKVRISNGASMAGMFYEMPSLRAIHFNDGFDVSNIWDATKMFYGDSGLEEGDFENLDFAYFSKAGSMFEGCSSLKEITIDFQAGNNFGSAFKGCTSLETVNITKGNVNPSWKTYTGMFDGCEALETVNLTGFDGASGESYSMMFRDCKSLESIDLSMLDLSATTDCSYMFSGCENLTALDLTQTSWNPSGVNMTGIIEGCTKLSELTTDESLVVSDSTEEIGSVEDPAKVKVMTDISIGLMAGAVLYGAVIYRHKHRKNYKHGQEYGSARWGNQKDIEPFIDPVFRNNIPLTATERLMCSFPSGISGSFMKPSKPKYGRNKNVTIVGGSGSGKTRFYVKPSIMQMHSSYVVTDPKGTLILETGRMLARGTPIYDSRGKPKKTKDGKTRTPSISTSRTTTTH